MMITVTVRDRNDFPSSSMQQSWADEIQEQVVARTGNNPGPVAFESDAKKLTWAYTVNIVHGLNQTLLQSIADSTIKPARSGHFTIIVS